MMTRPIPIIILAIIHFLEPIAKLFYASVYFKVPMVVVLNDVLSNLSNIQNLLALTLFPLAGFAILALKKWSLFAVVIIEIFSLGFNSYILFQSYAGEGTLYIISQLFLYSLNILVVIYLLLPAVRLAYTDPRVRWWESKRRYLVSINCEIIADKNLSGVIQNLSRTGAYIAMPEGVLNGSSENSLNVGQKLKVNFNVGNKKLAIDGVVARCVINPDEETLSKGNRGRGVGVKFNLTIKNWIYLFSSTLSMWIKGVPCRPKRGQEWREFVGWINHFLKTGKGLIPEYQDRN